MQTFEEFESFCIEQCFNEATANYSVCTESHFVDCAMYPKQILDLGYLVPVTIFLVAIFLTGLLGNLCVCATIMKHPSMRSETNVYLFSLAVSDMLLLVFGLAPELWYYWQTYPYIFGDFTCRLTNILRATGTWASALTVVAFSIERYTAICHHSPSRSRDRRRVAMAILAIWTISVVSALPGVHVHVVTNPVVVYPGTGKVPLLTQLCRIPDDDQYKYYNHLYAATCVLFFFIPMVVLLLVYIKIAVFLRSHRQLARKNGIINNCSEDNKIFKVLVAVVLAFFVCGAPYHYQRLTTIYSDSEYPEYSRQVFVLTAMFYYLSATINPILYNAMSKRYRKAFKEVITRTRKQHEVPMCTVEKETSGKYNTTVADSDTTVATSCPRIIVNFLNCTLNLIDLF